jgi:hypothetical protein
MGLHCQHVNMTNAWEARYLCHARSLGIRAHYHLKQQQRTYYVAAEYDDHNDRLLVEEGDTIRRRHAWSRHLAALRSRRASARARHRS